VRETQQAYALCTRCADRQGTGGARFEAAAGAGCYICSGTMERVEEMAGLALKKARPYEFRTFAVGVSLPSGVQEREDELRSTLKLKGNETIKTQAAGLIASGVARATRRRVDKRRPDVTILADFGAGDVSIASRPAFFYGRYSKPPGVAQRTTLCEGCRGAGCKKCRNTGYNRRPSVEGALRRKLAGFMGSDRTVFTWLGSEDEESRVYPPGRPFVAEVKNPKKREAPKRFGARVRGGVVSVTSGRMLPAKPVKLPSFRFRTRIHATSSEKVTAEGLAELRARFRGAQVTFQRPNDRPAFKTVYKASATARGRALVIDAELDGGLPVKRFVSGELVSPSVSEVLKTQVGCRSFDICGVREKGGFLFAEVARVEEKN
jgi:tRNA pseudouridine synthase 10